MSKFHRTERLQMSKEKFEHKDELDCEVTVFEGAHTTCSKLEDDSAETASVKKKKPGGKNIPKKIMISG